MNKVIIHTDVLAKQDCEAFINQYAQSNFIEGQVRTNDSADEKVYDDNIRKVHTLELAYDDHTDLFNHIFQHIKKANLLYQYDINQQLSNDLLLLKYEAGCHFKPHLDIASGKASFRKISFILQLSSPDSYLGCELAFYPDQPAPTQQGTLIIFPSNVMHMVTPLVTGVRYAIVGWITGDSPCIEMIVDPVSPVLHSD